MKNKKVLLLLVCITILSAVLRLYALGDIPWALNRDEASIGYNAYSLLKTGMDEHGRYWPINVESFGDWKLPVYMYSTMPFIWIFGLESWVVRLPSALAGIGLSLAVYYFIKAFKNKTEYDTQKIGLLSALFIAVSPWSFRLSRVAYEANLALFLAVVGISLVLKGLHTKSRWYIAPGLFFSFLTLLTYHAYQVFMPVLLFLLVLFYRRTILSIFRKNKPVFTTSLAIAIGFAYLLYIGKTGDANATKFSGLSVFSEETYHYQLYDARMMFTEPNGLLAKLYANSVTMVVNNLAYNLSEMLSPNFLVLNGGRHGSHDISGIGNIYPTTAGLAFISMCYAVYLFLRKEKSALLIIPLTWLAISFIAPIITIEAAHTIRFSPALVAFEVLAAVGFILVFNYLGSKVQKASFLLFSLLVLIFSFSQTIGTYFVVFPQRDHHKWPWYSQQLSSDLLAHKNEYSKIYMPQIDSSPYIFLLFDWQYDPSKLSTQLTYYPTDSGGFTHAKQLENIYFEKIDWQSFISSVEKELVFVEENEFKKQNLASGDYSIVATYTSNNSKNSYLLVSN